MVATQGSTTWTDISKIEESILAWRQYLGTNYGAGKPLGGGEEKCSKYPNWSERTKSLYGADESLAPVRYPRYTGQSEDRNFGLRSGGIACPRNSTEDLAEQLLGELDKAAAKVRSLITGLNASFIFETRATTCRFPSLILFLSLDKLYNMSFLSSSFDIYIYIYMTDPGHSYGKPNEKVGTRRCWM